MKTFIQVLGKECTSYPTKMRKVHNLDQKRNLIKQEDQYWSSNPMKELNIEELSTC